MVCRNAGGACCNAPPSLATRDCRLLGGTVKEGCRRWAGERSCWAFGRRGRRQRGLPLRLVEELETAPKEMMKAVGSSELGLLPAEGDDEENGFVLASSWGKNGKGELRWLLVKEGLLLAGEGDAAAESK
uniref:Uncharacterized protein n=1 Tax=Populus trichocarpa TaxID=3694 RepID=A0A3N7F9Y2_POPTR